MPTAQTIAHDAQTIEGWAEEGILHVIQQALVIPGVTPCAISPPEIVMAALSSMEDKPSTHRPRIRNLHAGNLCRWPRSPSISDAIEAAIHGVEIRPRTTRR
ncbi:MAG: hypothetical protein GY768_10870 [Planctomycetaceae bacterium]|nr:hypothetical protein [Planctomycetaceae bacterium]